MVEGIAQMMSWTKCIERERATLARSRALWKAKSEASMPAVAVESTQRRRKRKPKPKPKLDAAYVTSIASPGYGRAASVPLPHREGSNSMKPNEFWPIIDGSVAPKPERAAREYGPDYIFAVGTGTGSMMWPQDVSHGRDTVKARNQLQARQAGQISGSPEHHANGKEASRSLPCLTEPTDSRLRGGEKGSLSPGGSIGSRRLVRKAQSTTSGSMMWPQDSMVVH